MEWTILRLEIVLLGTRFFWLDSNNHIWFGVGVLGYGFGIREFYQEKNGLRDLRKCIQLFYPSPGWGSVWQIRTEYKFIFFGKVKGSFSHGAHVRVK